MVKFSLLVWLKFDHQKLDGLPPLASLGLVLGEGCGFLRFGLFVPEQNFVFMLLISDSYLINTVSSGMIS